MSSTRPPDRGNPGSAPIKTSLGPFLEQHGALWTLDLTQLPIFHGLSVISRALGEMIIDQAKSDRTDINVERAVRPRDNPELLHNLGVTFVKVAAEHDTIATLVRNPDRFQDNLRALFGTLQRDQYRNALFPLREQEASRALVFRFTFPNPEGAIEKSREFTFLLERVAHPRSPTQCSLRITIEDPARPRLALDSIRPLKVEDMESRFFIAGSTRIAETWTEGLRREAERNRRAFGETRQPHSHLFNQFRKAGLGGIEEIRLTWTDAFVDRILESDPAELSHLLKRVLLALEDRSVRRILMNKEVLRIVCDDVSLYLDQSQLGRVLNLSLGQRRERVDLDRFLDRMPATLAQVRSTQDLPLAGIRIFLIHHITAEILGLIAALRRLGCQDLTTLFVAYAGEAPGSYLGPLLDLPPREFQCMALLNVPDDESVEGHYKLSTQYSDLDSEAELTARLGRRRMRYFEAMQAVAVFEFMRQVERAEQEGGRCLILEDGGYLAPFLNRACLEGRTVKDFLAAAGTASSDDRPLKSLLEQFLIGSVEHTRNGMNRLDAVAQAHGCLAFPTFTIAASRLKIHVEAREVAMTVLNAVENVLHATGKILSRRHCLVLGSRGAIGRHLIRCLGERLVEPEAQVLGVDLKKGEAEGTAGYTYPESTTYTGLAEECCRTVDLVLGVTGESVLKGHDLQQWLLHGEPRELILASGSTKTEEFSDLAVWVDRLLNQAEPRVGGEPVAITVLEVKDPITSRLYGHRYRFTFEADRGGRLREVLFLANLTPVNFMFYGVPTEVIDEVLAQLLQGSLGLVRRSLAEEVPRALLAVDRDIQSSGDPL